MVDLAELKVFIAAAEESSFSRAAERLHLSQSAVSQNIQALERDFGVKLFVRQGRSVRVSEAGHVLLPMARELLGTARLMMDTMTNVQSQVVGELVIGCSTASGKYLLPNLLAAYRRDYPQVRVRVEIMGREDVLARLLDERLALGTVSRRVDHQDLDYEPFFEDRVVLIVPADHPWATFGRALPADLVDQPLIIREASAGTTQVLLDGLSHFNISPDMLDVVMEVGNPEAILVAVEEGIGIGFVSELTAARGLALGRVRLVTVEGLNLGRTIYLARNRRVPLTRAQDRFWSFAREHRAELARRLRESVSSLHLPAPLACD